jgi:molybdopterin synthase sulfur carrier subunit
MPLTVFLSSTLRKYSPGYDPIKGMRVRVDREMTVAELCEQMHLPADRIKIVMVNGKSESLGYVLKGDERIGLFPPVGGG